MEEETSEQNKQKKIKSGETSNSNPNSNSNSDSDLYVWPWCGIIANIPTQIQNGRQVGESGTKLKHQLSQFSPEKVHPVWTFKGHTGFATITFRKNWHGFRDAMDFESHFQIQERGKSEFEKSGFGFRREKEGIYGWMARKEDYCEYGPVAEWLVKNGNVKSIGDVQRDEVAMADRLVSGLLKEMEGKIVNVEEMESKCLETQGAFERIMRERDELLRFYGDEVKKMENLSNNHLRRIMDDNLKLQADLELKKKEAELANQKLLEGKKNSSGNVSKLSKDMKSLVLATKEKQKADEKVWNLIEEHKREKEKAVKKILELERKLEAKHSLQLEIHRINAQLERDKELESIEPEERERMERMREELREKLEEMEEIDTLNQTLIVKEKRSNEELEDARDVIIKGLEGRSSSTIIKIKKMGEISEEKFRKACEIKFHRSAVEKEVGFLLQKWQNEIQNPNWNPFKTEMSNGSVKEVIDNEDEKLQGLKNGLGDEAFDAVKSALMEIKEFNPTRKVPVPEIWNMKENRKATMAEATRFALNAFKLSKKKRLRD
ncbi:hypothetical protein LUZ60_011186 [Juncus effusus]|nr:hypothetical protein LUZ60_011186 [Juncus effusus]